MRIETVSVPDLPSPAAPPPAGVAPDGDLEVELERIQGSSLSDRFAAERTVSAARTAEAKSARQDRIHEIEKAIEAAEKAKFWESFLLFFKVLGVAAMAVGALATGGTLATVAAGLAVAGTVTSSASKHQAAQYTGMVLSLGAAGVNIAGALTGAIKMTAAGAMAGGISGLGMGVTGAGAGACRYQSARAETAALEAKQRTEYAEGQRDQAVQVMHEVVRLEKALAQRVTSILRTRHETAMTSLGGAST